MLGFIALGVCLLILGYYINKFYVKPIVVAVRTMNKLTADRTLVHFNKLEDEID